MYKPDQGSVLLCSVYKGVNMAVAQSRRDSWCLEAVYSYAE